MPLTTHEKIRVESGFQNRYLKEAFSEGSTIGSTTFYVRSDDYVKFVPEFGTGNTIGGVSDVAVWCGLTGVNGVSRMSVLSIDIDSGAVTLVGAPTFGCSLTITYASSQIPDYQIEQVRLQAESIISQRLSICYNLPITPTPSVLTALATRLAAALLLIRDYGAGARSTAKDGYQLYNILMGENEVVTGGAGDNEVLQVGEVGMICLPNYQLVGDDGTIIPRNDTTLSEGNNTFKTGGRVVGRTYDITEENFRYKPFQEDVDRDQPGTNNNFSRRQQQG